jgi:cyanophycinase
VTRPQANDETTALTLRDATGIFLTGGNQLRLASTIGGTRLADAILERFRHGAVVAGTSAGASAMSSHMIAFGASGATPKHRMAQIAAGLGLLPAALLGGRRRRGWLRRVEPAPAVG